MLQPSAIATTNHPERLDPAIRERPSRFDMTWHFDLPAVPERARYIERWVETLEPAMRPSAQSVASIAAEPTEGFSFAYLKELFVSATMRWINAPEIGRSMDLILLEQAALLHGQLGSARVIAEGPSPEAKEEAHARRRQAIEAMMGHTH